MKRAELIHGAVDKALANLVRVEGEMGKVRRVIRMRVLYGEHPAWAEAEVNTVVTLYGRCEDKPEDNGEVYPLRELREQLRKAKHVLDK